MRPLPAWLAHGCRHGHMGLGCFVSAQDLELIALPSRAQASGTTSATALMEGLFTAISKLRTRCLSAKPLLLLCVAIVANGSVMRLAQRRTNDESSRRPSLSPTGKRAFERVQRLCLTCYDSVPCALT